MKNMVDKTFDFDIAMVSCGGFGMILSDYIFSQLGKSVIYVGGCLQLFFGINGNRWKNHDKISKMINKSNQPICSNFSLYQSQSKNRNLLTHRSKLQAVSRNT